MGRLQHPGVAHVYECGTTLSGRPFHAMKLVEGKTLGDLLRERLETGKASAQLLGAFSVVCQAMAYTHSQGIIHLDLKPDNIMVGEFGEVHVMDWGLAKEVNPNNKLENVEIANSNGVLEENGVHGTLQYMAPEQARGETVDERTDVFCLGAILCEILTGFPPYNASERKEALKQAKSANLSSAFDRLNDCISELVLVRLAERCLSANPNDRPKDAGELVKEMAVYSESALERVRNDMTQFFELSLDLFCIAGFDGFFRRINRGHFKT